MKELSLRMDLSNTVICDTFWSIHQKK